MVDMWLHDQGTQDIKQKTQTFNFRRSTKA